VQSLFEIRKLHLGKRIIVCGLGPSLARLRPDHGCITIGVNDIGRWFTPDHHYVMDRVDSFIKTSEGRGYDRLKVITDTVPKRYRFIGTGFEAEWKRYFGDDYIRVPPQNCSMATALPDWTHGLLQRLHAGAGTPFTAVSLAGLLGAKEVGMIGVDMVDHPRVKDGDIPGWNLQYGKMVEFLAKKGIPFVNLSRESAIDRVPFADWGVVDREVCLVPDT